MPETRRALLAAAVWLVGAGAFAASPVELRPRTEAWSERDTIGPEAREPGQRFALRVGARLGELVLVATWYDFRGQAIAPGRYGLRYALQPRLKEHAGADAIRDFALLVPPDLPASDDWLRESRLVSRTTHPAVMALVPWQGEGTAPSELHEESPERLVDFRAVSGTTIGFVVLGRASEPEL